MFACRLSEAKSQFFDRVAVLTRLSKAERRVFNRVGATVRTYARRSMKPASKKKLKDISAKRREAGRLLLRKHQTAATQARYRRLQQEIRELSRAVHSRPHQPPKTIKGTIKRMLFYAFDPTKETVVVGPILFSPKTGAPETLEYGGTVRFGPRTATIVERPFMGPAQRAVQPQVAGMFRDSV